VVFAEPSDMALLGVRTLEGFGVMVDNVAHRFVATTTIVAATRGKTSVRIDDPRALSAGVKSPPRLAR
jgi:hypothetical protein